MTEALSPALPPVISVARAACERELRLVTAESCTGGLVASLLTDIEGCSHVFERGFVAYTNQSTLQMLAASEGLG